ncbi:MAG TPA: transglutaminase-like domain-containing protein, partial [Lachnospiraceae bacterium]|nr:transglutaminase-like domain-containing protein [Lachnospiraceae bacterium]
MIKKYAPLLHSLFYGFRICCLLLFAGLSLICFAGWKVPIPILILFCLLFSLIATLSDDRYFTSISYKIRRFIYPVILVIIFCVLLFRRYEGLSFFDYLHTIFTWLVQNLNNKAEYSMEYSLFVLFLLYLTLSLLIKFCEKYFKMQLCLSLLIIVCIFLLGAVNIDMSPLALFAGFFYIADTSITFCLRVLTKNKDVSAYCISLSTILIIMIGFVLLIPYSKDPIPYYRIGNLVDQVFYELSGLSQDLVVSFSNNFMGIGDSRINLKGGNVRQNDAIMIHVFKNTTNYNPIYLTSNIADYYSGNSWGNEIKTSGKEPEFLLNSDERTANLLSAGFVKDDPVFHHMSMKIKYRYIYTKSIIYPDNCLSVIDFTPTNSIVNKGLNIRFGRKPKLDSSYSVNLTEINFKDSKILEYLNNCSSFSESAKIDPEKYEELAPYLQLPPELPKRVLDLAIDITSDCSSDYEKADYIRQYVQQYPYSTDVSELPDDTDAVDYFLFEQKEGYCIHFASTLAVLCRSVGIPSRYIQGVAIGEGKSVYKWFEVPSSASHAWCEVYINGFGWIRMDATPIEQLTSYHNWPILTQEQPVEMDTNLPPMPYQPDEPVDTSLIDLEALRQRQEQQRILTLYAILALTILAGIVLILIIINMVSKEHKKRLFFQSSINEQASFCLQEILSHLTYLGITKDGVETMQEFTDRLNKMEPDQYLDT